MAINQGLSLVGPANPIHGFQGVGFHRLGVNPPIYYPTPVGLTEFSTVYQAGGSSSPASTGTPTAAPVSEYATSPLEYPGAGNIPPSTDPYASIVPATGQVVSSVPGTSLVDSITSWVQANPILALALAGGVAWVLMEMFGPGGSHRRR